MAQTGLHGLVGLAAARLVVPHAPAGVALPLTLAVTLGTMLPDLDLYPASITYLLTSRYELSEHIHRSLTHSVFLMAALAGSGLALRPKWPAAGWVLLGLPLGMLTHAVLDIFMWFAALDTFWPLSHLSTGAVWWWPAGPIPESRAPLPVLDIWNMGGRHGGPGRHLPAVFGNRDFIVNALGSMETAAFALFFGAVGHIAGSEAVKRRTRGLRRWTTAAWVLSALLLLAAFPLSNTQHMLLSFAALLLVVLPYGWVLAWRQREPLAAWARGH